MKYAGIFSESIKNPSICKSDKYGRKAALQDYSNQPCSEIRTGTNNMYIQNEHRLERHSAYAEGYVTNQQQPIRNNRINNPSDRGRTTSLYTQNRHTIDHSYKSPIDHHPSTTNVTILHDVANYQRSYRHSTINYKDKEKYSRNYEPKYKQDYGSKMDGIYEHYKTPKGQTVPHSKENYQYNISNSNPYEHRARARPERAYSGFISTGKTVPIRSVKPQTSNYHLGESEKAYDCEAGKELLRNLDKVQEKIRNLLKQ